MPEARAGISRTTRFYYGMGSVAYGVKDNGFSYFLLLYYNQVLGLPAPLASTAIFTALVLDAISDPIVGNISDRLHSRFGRRHPFMYAAALPVSVSFYFLWNPPDLSERSLFYYLLGMAILIRTFITFYEVPSTALAPELTEDYDERTKLASARHFFGWAGGIGIAVVAYLFLFVPTEAQPTGQLNPAGYEAYGLVGACLMFAAIMISALGTHRHIPYLKSPPPRRHASLTRTVRETRETLANRSFFALFGFGIFGAMAAGLVGAMGIYINTYFWELSARQIGLIVPTGFFSAAIALFAAPALAKRWGKKTVAIGLSVLAAGLAPVPIFARFADLMPENGSDALLVCLIAYNVVEIALIITSTTLVSAMMADVVEESELRTGRRSEGIFFAARSFVTKSLTGLGIVLGTLVLTAVDFPRDARPGDLAPEIVRDLGLAYAPLVAGLYAAAVGCLLAYRITREQHAANVAALRARQGAAT